MHARPDCAWRQAPSRQCQGVGGHLADARTDGLQLFLQQGEGVGEGARKCANTLAIRRVLRLATALHLQLKSRDSSSWRTGCRTCTYRNLTFTNLLRVTVLLCCMNTSHKPPHVQVT